MTLPKYNKIKNILIKSLNDYDISKFTKNEINFFNNKNILITGASGIIGINLIFLLNKIIEEKKCNITIDGVYKTSLFHFVIDYFKKKKKLIFLKLI